MVVGAALVFAAFPAFAQEKPAAYLSHIAVATDAEPDMTSVESILAAIIKPGMTDEEKALAVWKFVYDHRFWAPSSRPVEFGKEVVDPVLILNCFPALICQQDAGVISALWAGAGFDVRYWQMGSHTTSEVFYGGKWHLLDATLGRTTRGPDGSIADATKWTSMYKPKVSRVTPWDDYEIGHHMDLTLRRGETFTRSWYPLSTKDPDYWRPGSDGRIPTDKLGEPRGLDDTMSRKPYRFEIKGAGLANGVFEFKPDFKDPRWRESFESVGNVRGNEPAELVWRMHSPYIITGAWVESKPAAEVSVSTDDGRTWKAVKGKNEMREQVAGRFDYLVRMSAAGGDAGLSDLKITTVVQTNPLSLPALKSGENTIRVSAGEQTETLTIHPNLQTPDYRREILEESNIVTAREQLQEGWITGVCSREGDKESYVIYKVTTPGEMKKVRWGGRFRSAPTDVNEMSWSLDGKGWTKQPMSTRWTFPKSDTPNLYVAYSETTEGFPAGTKTVFLKYLFKRSVPKRDMGDLHLATALRIDAEYVPERKARSKVEGLRPKEQPAGAGPSAVPLDLRPSTLDLPFLQITYTWAEDEHGKSVEKTHTEVVRSLPYSYKITVGGEGKPLMKSIRMRLVE